MVDTHQTPSQWLPWCAVLALWVLGQSVLVRIGVSPIADHALIDPDSYMRLVRIRELWQTGDWFDTVIARANAPYGDALHWTRLFDGFLLLGVFVLKPFLGFEEALYWSGAVASPLLLLLTAVVIGWAGAPLLRRQDRFFAMAFLLLQPAVLVYGMIGRADHHALQLLLFALHLGFVLRLLINPLGVGAMIGAGLTLALGFWVSTEFLLSFGLLLVVFGVLWLQNERWAVPASIYCITFAVALGGAIAVERPFADWFTISFDRISIVHLTLAILSVAAWTLLATFARTVWARRPSQRALLALAVGATALGLMYGLFPRFFGGPMVDVDPRLFPLWMDNVGELRPILLDNQDNVSRVIFYIGPAFLTLPYLAVMTISRIGEPESRLYGVLFLASVLLVGLAMQHVRFAPLVELTFAIPLADILSRFRNWAGRLVQRPLSDVLRTVISGAMLIGFLVTGSVVGATPEQNNTLVRRDRCPLADLSALLNDPAGLGDRRRIIVAMIDHGPELLYHTGHAVIATPYHRNRDGIVDVHRIMTDPEEAVSRGLIDRRGADLLMICPNGPENLTYGEAAEKSSLFSRLLTNNPPRWLVPVSLPEDLAKSVKLYRVARPTFRKGQ
jgi:hypothetical protein